MDFLELAKKRYSVRKYEDKKVAEEKLLKILEATELGLGTLWMCAFDPAIIRKEFNIPENFEPINILGIGYSAAPAESPDTHDNKRKPLDNTVFYETF